MRLHDLLLAKTSYTEWNAMSTFWANTKRLEEDDLPARMQTSWAHSSMYEVIDSFLDHNWADYLKTNLNGAVRSTSNLRRIHEPAIDAIVEDFNAHPQTSRITLGFKWGTYVLDPHKESWHNSLQIIYRQRKGVIVASEVRMHSPYVRHIGACENIFPENNDYVRAFAHPTRTQFMRSDGKYIPGFNLV